jgi:succinylglutamic semialdehyde dehydrogenase
MPMDQGTHFVDGRWIEGEGDPFSSEDPAEGEVVWEGRAATEKEVAQAAAAARRAFASWADMGLSARIGYLDTYRERLRSSRDELADAISRETGKPKWESFTEVDSMIAKIAVSVDAYNDRCRELTAEAPGARGITRFRPIGVVAVFGPFNLPGHLPNGHIVPALTAGNTVVFKPSGQAPLVAQSMVRSWEDAGLPPGVLNLVQGRGGTGPALAAQPEIDGIFFTGSVETGRVLHRLFAGRPEKMLALEMGGNNPLIVWDVSDPRSAAVQTILSAFITSGQRCTCARRLIVPRGPEGEEFINLLASLARRIRVGPYTDTPEPFMGPVISEEAAEELLAAQERLAGSGGKIIVEMRPLGKRRNMLAPGIIDVTAGKDRPDEEYFGPFLQVIMVEDFDAALEEACNTAYGLAAGLFSDDPALYERFLGRIRAGTVNWNRQTTGASSRMPFGGVGVSGNHRPSAYFAADYCSYPVASIETEHLREPEHLPPGITR